LFLRVHDLPAAIYNAEPASQTPPVLNLATWMRRSDEKHFRRSFAPHPQVRVWNALRRVVPLHEMHGLLLTGGADIAPEFLHQEVPDPSVLDKDANGKRDRWEFEAIRDALGRQLPIFAICKGLQVFNVALGGTLHLDIAGHNRPEMRDSDVQSLRTNRGVAHRFDKVNSSHHQAIDKLGDGCEVEAWCANDEIIEQIRLRDYPFGLAVQYHPERGENYASLFADFVSKMQRTE